MTVLVDGETREIPGLSAEERLAMLKADLNRTGNFPGDDTFLQFYMNAAMIHLSRSGIKDDEASPDYDALLVSTAAWIYRKRVSGEAEPDFLRRMRHDYLIHHAYRPAPERRRDDGP